MKLLKIEDHDYQIIYINDNESYNVYRRFSNGNWSIFRRNAWRVVENSDNLEEFYKTIKNEKSSMC